MKAIFSSARIISIVVTPAVVASAMAMTGCGGGNSSGDGAVVAPPNNQSYEDAMKKTMEKQGGSPKAR